MMELIPFLGAALLFGIGLFALVFKRNLIKIAMGLSIIDSSVNLFLIALGYRSNGIAPIFTTAPVSNAQAAATMVLPAPQALTLTSIVIGLAVSALMLSLAVLLFKHYGSADARKIRGLRE